MIKLEKHRILRPELITAFWWEPHRNEEVLAENPDLGVLAIMLENKDQIYLTGTEELSNELEKALEDLAVESALTS